MIKKATLLIIVLCLVGARSFAQTENWTLFKEDGFEILFPFQPKPSKQTTNSAIGPLDLNIYMCEIPAQTKDENLVYLVMTTLYPDSLVSSDNKALLPDFFKVAIDGGVKNVNGKLLLEEEIKIQGYPGRRFKISFNENKNIITMYAYLVKNKMFMLEVVAATEKETNQSARRFFESFTLSK